MEHKPVLVTLTAPTAAGKSYLLNYIRDEAKLPCLISTTTRKPRANEVEGKDYFFISEEESNRIESEDGFAELAIYRGVRYGVTKEEFYGKLNQGIAFLIVEPSGIDHYAKPAIDAGAEHLKFYVHVDPSVRQQRFMDRAMKDIEQALAADAANIKVNAQFSSKDALVLSTFKSYMDRQRAVCTVESQWYSMVQWDRILFGTESPEINLKIILDTVKQRRALKLS